MFPIALLLPACVVVAERPGDPDEDGDGVTVGQGDCDDGDPEVHPGLAEDCDGIDDNCSGDEADAPPDHTWYTDADADGHGDAAAPVPACTAPSGTVGPGDDCDDADAGVFPGAGEVCDNGADDDCDGDWSACRVTGALTDWDFTVELPDTHYAPPALIDLDDDPELELVAASPDHGVVQVLHIDVAAGGVLRRRQQIVGDLGLGAWGHNVGDVGQGGGEPERDDLLLSAQRSGAPGVVVFYGPLYAGNDVDWDGEEAGWILSEADWPLGLAVAERAGDVDGDGEGEVVLGAKSASGGPGRVYLLAPDPNFDVVAGSTGTTVEGVGDGDEFGAAVIAPGDVDGDGTGDVLAGAPGAGAVYLVSGGVRTAKLLGTEDLSLDLGRELWAGDVDGDAASDLLVEGEDGWWLVRGPLDPGVTVWITAADRWLQGGGGQRAGIIDDLDGDDVSEVLWMDPDAPGCDTSGGLAPYGELALSYGGAGLRAGVFDATGSAWCSDEGFSGLLGPFTSGDIDRDGRAELLAEMYGYGISEFPWVAGMGVRVGRGR